MREHPIPQDIVGYRFHIVGNMTIKQFAEIGVGVFLAFIIYQTNLITFIKWPLMAISVAVGALMAFVPFEERALDHWIFTFFKALYRPTKFYWKREAHIPDAFSFTSSSSTTTDDFLVDLTPARRDRIKEYMWSLRTVKTDTFDDERNQSISMIMTTFQDTQTTLPANQSPVAKPRLKVRVRNLRDDASQTTPSEPTVTTPAPVEDWSVDVQTQLSASQLAATHQAVDVSKVAQDIAIPEQELISVELQGGLPTESLNPPLSPTSTIETPIEPTQLNPYQLESVPTEPTNELYTAQATFNEDLPFPTRPTEANVLVGMVLTPQHDLVNDAVVEIKATSGTTIRAVKTNALGQFFITTPLENGSYTIEVQKPAMSFLPVSISLADTVVDPIEIRSIV